MAVVTATTRPSRSRTGPPLPPSGRFRVVDDCRRRYLSHDALTGERGDMAFAGEKGGYGPEVELLVFASSTMKASSALARSARIPVG